MANMPPPPVPPRLREMLEDYPELIQELQEALASSHLGPRGPLDFDRAVWLLQDMLGGSMADADEEAEAAKARGDSQAIEQANEKAHLIGCARSDHPWNDDGEGSLWDYFQIYKGGVL